MLANKIVSSKKFDYFITFLILLNCVLIGVETYSVNQTIIFIQHSIVIFFVIEIFLRFSARESVKKYFSDAWNIFDISIVLVSLIPESLFADSYLISVVRVLRVFRILRLLKVNQEIKLILAVLYRSIRSLFYNALFFLIFFYLFAVIGVELFRLPTENSFKDSSQTELLEFQQKLEKYKKIAPNAPINSPDPFSTLTESFFTLFRIMTSEDWTDIRYNLTVASEMTLIKSSKTIITAYHVLWIILSSFLLLNLVVGAVLNNYQVVMDEFRKKIE